MTDRIVRITDEFWTVRGAFRILGVLNVGAHASLARLASGGFALLDSYAFDGPIKRAIHERTDQGRAVEAIINLHPFHTVHVQTAARMFPRARLYGTARHRLEFPGLAWEVECTEDAAFAAIFAEDFTFTVPRGVPFVADNENLHFSSVLAFHRASRTLHVDDTLNWLPRPWGGHLAFHPSLKALLKGQDAANEFRAWAEDLASRCELVENLCTAHTCLAPLRKQPRGAIAAHVRRALERVEPVLRARASA
jgi:hypothetical protein